MAGQNTPTNTQPGAVKSNKPIKPSGSPRRAPSTTPNTSASARATTPPKAPAAPKAPAPPQPPAVRPGGPSNAAAAGTAEISLVLPKLPTGSSATEPPPDFITAAAKAVALSFGSTHYAIVGGAACLLLGSTRQTTDIDAVVAKGETKTARDKLAAQKTHFSVDPKTRHTNYLSKPAVEIEILTPPLLFKENFDKDTPTVTVAGGIKILKPTLILNAKCGSILGRANEAKKLTDSRDIKYLLTWCAANKMWPTAKECPKVNKEFVEWFDSTYGGKELFKHAGWDETNGKLIFKHRSPNLFRRHVLIFASNSRLLDPLEGASSCSPAPSVVHYVEELWNLRGCEPT